MKIVVIVQARLNSTRLPGKILKTVLGKPLLEYGLERLRRVKRASRLVVATTNNPSDEPIVNLCKKLKVDFFRGDEEDVLERFYGAALEHQADVVVRVNSDCPLIDPSTVDTVIEQFLSRQPDLDYCSNILAPSFPIGMHTEVFSFEALEKAYQEAQDIPEREHVTPFIYRNPKRFRLESVVHNKDLSQHRWTLDQKEDLTLISKIIEALYPANPNFSTEDILELLEANPTWPSINNHIFKQQTIR
jgi:spore coat polysaccharide biosynthesis protein SpsF